MQPLCKAAVVGALTVALAGCSTGAGIDAAGGTAPPPDEMPLPDAAEGALVVGLGGLASPRTLNPLLDGPDTEVLDAMGAAVFASAYSLDPITREPIPAVMFEIPSVAGGGVVVRPDGTQEVTYRVAPSARWSDGMAITAEDLRFTYEVATDEALPIRHDVRSQYAAVVPGSVSAEGLTLRLALGPGGDPTALFGIILPAHQVAGGDFAHDWTDRMWAAAGPFAFAGWQPGHYLRLRRNPHYVFTDPAHAPTVPVEEVIYRFFPEADGARLEEAFAARLLDVAVLPAGAGLAGYEALAGQGAALQTALSPHWVALLFQFGEANGNTRSLNAERRFREAVARAVDREEVGRSLGTGSVASIYTSGPVALAGGAWEQLDPDPGRVAGLLAELGGDLGLDLSAGDGPRMLLSVAASDAPAVQAAEVVGSMLRLAGIAAEVQLEESALFHGATLPGATWDVAVMTLASTPGLEGARMLARAFDGMVSPGDGNDLGRWGTSRAAAAGYASVIARLGVAADEATTVRLLRRAEEILAEQVVLLPLAAAGRVAVAHWADRVEGVRVDADAGIAAGLASWERAG